MKKVNYLENKEVLDSICESHGYYFGQTAKIYLSESKKSLLAYEFNPTGMPDAWEVIVFSTPEDSEEIMVFYQNLLKAKKNCWIHVTVSVNAGQSQWFIDNRYRLYADEGTWKRFEKALNREKVREFQIAAKNGLYRCPVDITD